MASNWEQTAETMLKSNGKLNIAKKKNEIEKLANSENGKRVKQMFDGDKAVSAALKKGDMAALGSALKDILKTDEGAKLAKQLSQLMDK